jgi:hypothetical protein
MLPAKEDERKLREPGTFPVFYLELNLGSKSGFQNVKNGVEIRKVMGERVIECTLYC